MFNVSFALKDKKLADVLKFLDAVGVYNMQVVPVRNIIEEAEGMVAATSNGTMYEIMQKGFEGKKGDEVTVEEMRKILEAGGKSRISFNTICPRLVEDGLIKRVDKGVYKVMK